MNENKFSINQKSLLSLLASMQPICSKRTTLDVTEYILFHVTPRELTLKATDLEISLQTSMLLEKNTIEDATFLVSGKRIFELVKELEEEIEFTIEQNQFKLKAGTVDLALNIRAAEDFPPFPERIENLMRLEASFFLEVLSKVAFIIPSNNANQALNAMLFEVAKEKMSMVATDGHCLAHIEVESDGLEEEKKWLVPKRAVVEIKKILETSSTETLFLGLCGSQLVFSGTNFNFFTKLIADPFPEYKPVLNSKGFRPATLAKGEFIKTLKRANCFLAGQFISTKFQFTPSKLDVSLHNKEVGKLEESLSLSAFDGEQVESRFYSPYLLNGLLVFPDDKVKLLIKNTTKPIIFESKQEKYHFTYLVMPVSASAT